MTMLLAQHGVMGNPFGTLIPTDKTKTNTDLTTLDEGRYYLSSLIHQNPKDKRILVHTFADGLNHVFDAGKKISYRVSTDKGATWGAKATLYDPSDSTYQVQDPGIGMDRKGRLHIFADCHTSVGTPGGSHELRYMYSDDNGATVSSPVVIALPSTPLNAFRMYGRVIDNGNGVLLATMYFATDEGDATQSSRYVLRSTTDGADWAAGSGTWVLVEGPTSEFVNEGECLAITPNIIIMMCRNDTSKLTFVMYKSTDAGATWSRVGLLGTTLAPVTASPCRLHKFRADNGKWWCVMYFANKDTNRIYALYGRLDNGVDAGIGLFNMTTLSILKTDSVIIHYGDFCHYNGNMNARGAWPRENGSFPTDNEMLYFELGATHYNTIFAAIDPITIYDKLSTVSFIAAWRGLASNTTNDWGIVNGSGQVTTLKSILPGPTGQNFTATAGGILLDSDGITFDGTKALSHGTSTYWNFMSYSGAGESDVNYTIWLKLKIGTGSNPNAFYGVLGNSAGSASNRGMYLAYDDRAAIPASDRIALQISKGSAGFVVTFQNDNVITPNAFHVVQIRVDLSEASNNNKVKLEVDGVAISTTVSAYNTGIAANPTFNMQIGNIGNNTAGGYFIGTIKDVIIQNAIDIVSVRSNFTDALMAAS